MEAIILQQLKEEFPTLAQQKGRLIELINNFGRLKDYEFKSIVADILCLAKMIYEGGDINIVLNIRRQIIDLELAYSNNRLVLQKLEYLNKCMSNFKPAIFKNIQSFFAKHYGLAPELIVCLPKIKGQQVGAKVEIKKAPDDTNPEAFYVKSHQEFCSKSDPNYIAITSDGTGQVNFKELFIYKVLEYIGYGPKTHFIIDSETPHTRIEEGVLIATQDLGYTKKPHQKAKSFKTFGELREELSSKPIEKIDEETKKDIIAIDILSRTLLLEDVMINQGNFGMTVSSSLFEPRILSSKWSIVDFMPPVLRNKIGDDYSYRRHYPGGVSIFHSFRIGNASHTYDREELEIINLILSEKHAQNFWLPAIGRLSNTKLPFLSFSDALEKAFEDVRSFISENTEILQIKPDRLERRMADLDNYKIKVLQNFTELELGIREYDASKGKSMSYS